VRRVKRIKEDGGVDSIEVLKELER